MANAAILPNHMKLGLRPARLALDDLIWPMGQPSELRGGQLGDLSREDHLICFPRSTLHMRPSFGTRAQVSIMVLEPGAIHARHLTRLRSSYRRFHRVLTANRTLLDAIPNGIFFPFGGTWVENWRDLKIEKSQMCSLIASAKRSETGHVLRHEMADWIATEGHAIDVMGGGYAPFKRKSDGLAPYRYSLVIENVQEPNYFTEKLVDAILCQCVPIYWGCPNIANFIDPAAMIITNSIQEMQDAVRNMSKADYAARLPTLLSQQEKAAHWGDVYTRAAWAVLDPASGQMP
ncbi:glycosyltransferase family 10 domain-containing protein [Roseovarius sp. 2305UL8-3]|uniref:glycosyltransferase family 10 domain-containing protein n=1 Tax=Roseovarius conchicola TaxID=3121636 RepID=UPI003529452B